MKIETPRDLIFDQLRDIHSFESQLVGEFEELASLVSSPDLRVLLSEHSRQTEFQRVRAEGIFKRHGVEIGSDKCKAMEGLLKGGRKHLKQAKPGVVRDLLMTAHCGRIKNYEIAAYQFTMALADCLELAAEAEELSVALAEEEEVKRALAQAAGNIFQPCMLEQA